jgi:hypothetical protein
VNDIHLDAATLRFCINFLTMRARTISHSERSPKRDALEEAARELRSLGVLMESGK